MVFRVFFILLTILHLAGYMIHWPILSDYTKPFLMPSLIGNYVTSIGGIRAWTRLDQWLILALVFSTLGDILLLFDKSASSSFFFPTGLGAFLIAHIFYILAFRLFKPIQVRGIWLLVYISYGALLLYYLVPVIPVALKFPVVLYAGIICLMAWNSWCITDSIYRPGGKVIWGSFLFMISDSVLAWNKFYQLIPFASIIIMSTYLAAQWAIQQGILEVRKTGGGYQMSAHR
jgi:uncharacterized membrane protein YhhN